MYSLCKVNVIYCELVWTFWATHCNLTTKLLQVVLSSQRTTLINETKGVTDQKAVPIYRRNQH